MQGDYSYSKPGAYRWLKYHSNSGIFPYWTYAGEHVLSYQCHDCSEQIRRMINHMIGLSKNDYKKSYDFICVFNKWHEFF